MINANLLKLERGTLPSQRNIWAGCQEKQQSLGGREEKVEEKQITLRPHMANLIPCK